jgi:hypothetical protein
MRDLVRRCDIEVDPASDDPGRHRPERDISDEGRVSADAAHPALRDEDGKRDADYVHEPVVVDEQRADVKAVAGRARYEAQRYAGVRGHATKTRPTGLLFGARCSGRCLFQIILAPCGTPRARRTRIASWQAATRTGVVAASIGIVPP